LLVTSIVEPTQKLTWLKWWNSKRLVKENLQFPTKDVATSDFTHWLHETTFWAQVNHGFQVMITIISFILKLMLIT